jgi:hypothetical protein
MACKVKLVVGYLPYDRLPPEGRRLGLTQRTAFILGSYRSDKVDEYFDTELYAALVDSVRRTVRADKTIVVLSSGESADVSTGPDFERQLRVLAQNAQLPLSKITCVRGSLPVAMIGSEPYANVGGPPPYHDSYTVPALSREDISEALENEARVVCRAFGAEMEPVIRGERVPTREGPAAFLLRNLRQLLGW